MDEENGVAYSKSQEGIVKQQTILPKFLFAGSITIAIFVIGCDTNKPAESGLSATDARAIAKEAFIYGFPVAANYQTMYKQAIDKNSPDYRGTFNTITSSKSVATPDDKFVVTPNSDTPYSFLWMDLRAEPIVITMPKIEKNRYYSGQLIDLYTFNFAYLGTRAYGNEGGNFLIAGPGWKGKAPAGIKMVLHSQTQLAYILFRTQLFNPGDINNVRKIQADYRAVPLSTFSNQPAPPPAAPVRWPKPAADMLTSPTLYTYLNFLLQFCPLDSSETDLMRRFAKLNVGADKTFAWTSLAPDTQQAITDGIKDAGAELEAVMKQIN